ncbi:hypothetical protein WOLCODRAFT_21558 [Wolfiporia cocos MD-104 SS10]|uniref:Uncharacterized protein n=1 Tax=Wolfiporia cocos (strain MD-104) TaxID=742152 RepID=A0A2H3JLI1_WOLCO|nr:hypothetical protein WOLCODRAFT_21558 [Wolfiporia cocos MD-104 SS10]
MYTQNPPPVIQPDLEVHAELANLYKDVNQLKESVRNERDNEGDNEDSNDKDQQPSKRHKNHGGMPKQLAVCDELQHYKALVKARLKDLTGLHHNSFPLHGDIDNQNFENVIHHTEEGDMEEDTHKFTKRDLEEFGKAWFRSWRKAYIAHRDESKKSKQIQAQLQNKWRRRQEQANLTPQEVEDGMKVLEKRSLSWRSQQMLMSNQGPYHKIMDCLQRAWMAFTLQGVGESMLQVAAQGSKN